MLGGKSFINQISDIQYFEMDNGRLKNLFRRWEHNHNRYFNNDVICALRSSKIEFEKFKNNGTLERLANYIEFLKNKNINRKRKKKSIYTNEPLAYSMYIRLSLEKNGVATIIKTVEWLLITYEQLTKNNMYISFTYSAHKDLKELLHELLNSPIGTLFKCTSGGKYGNIIGERFETQIKRSEKMFKTFLNNNYNISKNTTIKYNINLYRKSRGKEILLREIDIAGFDVGSGALIFWGEIKSNMNDVKYKAKSQFYKFLSAFTSKCPSCLTNESCTCKLYFKDKKTMDIYPINAAWIYDVPEIASLHAVVITQYNIKQMPIISDLGHIIVPLFLNYLTGFTSDKLLESAIKKILFVMNKYKHLISLPDPIVVTYKDSQ